MYRIVHVRKNSEMTLRPNLIKLLRDNTKCRASGGWYKSKDIKVTQEVLTKPYRDVTIEPPRDYTQTAIRTPGTHKKLRLLENMKLSKIYNSVNKRVSLHYVVWSLRKDKVSSTSYNFMMMNPNFFYLARPQGSRQQSLSYTWMYNDLRVCIAIIFTNSLHFCMFGMPSGLF